MLCENPIVNDGRVFVFHAREPMILAEVHHYEAFTDEELMDIERQITTPAWSRLDYPPETIYFFAVKFFPDERFIKKDAQGPADELAGIMRRMADWYEAYLIWEDKQLGNYEEE